MVPSTEPSRSARMSAEAPSWTEIGRPLANSSRDGEVRHIVARAEIAAQQIAEIVDILQPERVVEAELRLKIGLDLGA